MSKLETARRMALAHKEIDPAIQKIYLIEPVREDDPREPIKLLEVVEGTFEVGIEPIGFVPEPEKGVPYASVIVEVSPREFEAIRSGKLDLAVRGWSLGQVLGVG